MVERSAGLPGMSLGELIAIFALGQDNAFGQPLESQMRSTLLATWMTEASGLPARVRDTTYWVAQLRYIGCTGHAHEVAVMFGDEIETRARSLLYDAANPVEVLRDALAHGHPDQRGFARLGAMVSILAGGRTFAEMNFRTGCEVAEAIAGRLGMDQSVREALRCSFERWNGKGQPNGVKGEHIPLPMRIVHLTHDVEALARLCSPADAVRVVRRRSGRAYDPAVVAEFLGLAVTSLTAREAEVLELVARGLTTKAIAQRLVISPKTADTHIQHIYTKIGTTTRGAAALFAMQHDLVH